MCENKTKVLGNFSHWQAESLDYRQEKQKVERSLLLRLYKEH